MIQTPYQRLNLAFMRRLVETPTGRAHVLAQVADAESTGESRLFDHILAQLDDPALLRMVHKHRDDELRHERLFRDRLAQTAAAHRVPSELRLVDRLDTALGGFFARPIRDARGVTEAYALLWALETRAVESFSTFIAAFDRVDPETASVFRVVRDDERRHVRYCEAVLRRCAPSERERLATLNRFRAIEARVFRDNQLANMSYVLDRGYVRGVVWRVVHAAASATRAFGARPPRWPADFAARGWSLGEG